jgi:hypothetical protein
MKSLGYVIVAALVMFGAVVTYSAKDAYAQSGSRLCGIAFATTGIFIEIKQPSNKGGRNAMNKFCRKVADGMRDTLKKKGVSNADSWKYYERSECEGVAGELSGGANRADICEAMERTGDPKNVHAYTVQFKGRDGFSVTRQ